MTSHGILIADDDQAARQKMAEQLSREGYQVTATGSAAAVLYGTLKKTARVVLLGTRLDEFSATDLIPILKQCNRHLKIILVASELPLSLVRRARSEGIFYHALRTGQPEDEVELSEAVRCAIEQDEHQS
ncbi:MAG TPA: response regulator [Desulfuromonadales bacterium]|nr:response regulator [Desulfuromonadales bacterium]